MQIPLRSLLLALLNLCWGCGQPGAAALSTGESAPAAMEQFLEFRPLDGAGGEDLRDAAVRGTDHYLCGWEPFQFEKIPRKTKYSIVRIDDQPALLATAERAASAIRRKVSIDPEKQPRIEWTWRVTRALDDADCTRKDGDDCAARVMLLYRYDPADAGILERARFETAKGLNGEYPPRFMLVYAWAESARKEAFLKSPYSDRIGVIPVRSGSEKAGRWITERRNHVEDFRRVFGEEPPEIEGLAVMVDTDNIGASATSWFRSLRIGTDEP